MKHDELRSIAHNIADSLASGIGLLIGVYQIDVFGEAAKSKPGFITVDFLTGATDGGVPSATLAKAIQRYGQALPALCEKHGASVQDFKSLTARYFTKSDGNHVVIAIEDKTGRHSTDEYVGTPLKHIKVLDDLGRVRTQRGSK